MSEKKQQEDPETTVLWHIEDRLHDIDLSLRRATAQITEGSVYHKLSAMLLVSLVGAVVLIGLLGLIV